MANAWQGIVPFQYHICYHTNS